MICAKGKTSIGRSTESCGSWARRLAIKRGQCSKNPADSVERAVQAARELKADDTTVGSGTDTIDPDSVLNPKEIQVLLREANPGFERTLFETAYLTGAREGELLALRWTDLDLPKEGSGRMAIRRSLSWARVQGEEIRPRYYPPKTKQAAERSRFPLSWLRSSSIGNFNARSQRTGWHFPA
jgi:integrase